MICEYCKAEIADNTEICPFCGAKVEPRAFTPTTTEVTKSPLMFSKWIWLLWVYLFFIFVALTTNTSGCAVFVVFCAVFEFFLVKTYRKRRDYLKKYDSETLLNNPEKVSDEYLTKALILDEIKKEERHGSQLFSKTVIKKRWIFTAIFSLSLLLIGSRYYSLTPIYFFGISILLYTWIMGNNTLENVLYKKAKKSPNTPISEIIKNHTYDEIPHPKRKLTSVICCLLLIFPLIVTLFSIQDRRYVTEDTEGGCIINSCSPGIFQMRSIDIPEEIDGKKVVAIDNFAFSSHSFLERVTMPDSVETIGEYAFGDCIKLTEIKLSKNLKEIHSSAFEHCDGLKNIDLPAGLTLLGGEAFYHCKNLESIVIPNGVTEIRGNTFGGCSSLKSVTLHDGITAIHASAFKDCSSLQDIELPSKITEIRANTFENCTSLKEIDIPYGVTVIRAHAFHGCSSLREVYIPYTLKEIRSSAFRECSSLTEIYLPSGVVIDERAFKDSPTEIKDMPFTEEQEKEILDEVNNGPMRMVYYYVYDTEDGKDSIYRWNGSDTVIIADSPEFKEKIRDNCSMAQVLLGSDLTKYLKKAKAKGIKTVIFAYYSETASELKGIPWFVYATVTIDEAIEQMELN